jgi:hypothetical protein
MNKFALPVVIYRANRSGSISCINSFPRRVVLFLFNTLCRIAQASPLSGGCRDGACTVSTACAGQ